MWFLVMLACSSSEVPQQQPAAPEAAVAKTVATPAVPVFEGGNMTPDLYRRLATELTGAIESGQNADVIAARAQRLTLTGLGLLTNLRSKHPECEAYFDAIVQVAPKLGDMPLERIETGFHADGELPKSPGGACYHGKDLVVHPATVVALAKAGLKTPEDRNKAVGEITEVLNHLTAVQ